MGAAQSTRTITISNDDVTFITVSESLAKRMAGEGNKEYGKSARADNQTPPPPAPTFAPAPTRPLHGEEITVIPGYTPISSMQLRREVEAARNSVEKYWQHRMHQRDINDERALALEEESFKKGIADVQKAFKGYNSAPYENPCTDKSSVLMQCYKDNPKQPLNCHNEVQAFCACVEQKHRNMMEART